MRTWLPFPLHHPIAAGWVLVGLRRAICSSWCSAALPRRGSQRRGAVEEDVLKLQRGGVLALQQLCRHRLRWHQFCGTMLHLLAVPTSCSRVRRSACPSAASAAGVLHFQCDIWLKQIYITIADLAVS